MEHLYVLSYTVWLDSNVWRNSKQEPEQQLLSYQLLCHSSLGLFPWLCFSLCVCAFLSIYAAFLFCLPVLCASTSLCFFLCKSISQSAIVCLLFSVSVCLCKCLSTCLSLWLCWRLSLPHMKYIYTYYSSLLGVILVTTCLSVLVSVSLCISVCVSLCHSL